MNLPMSWLNDYMDIDVTPKEYSDRLTMTGSKVEGWENMGESVQNVVAGKVLTCEDHPDSDHLHVCTVDAGTGEILQIVCGAPNVKAGIIVPVALVGAVLPDGKIKKGKLRGVESYGMLCSHDELGITEDMLGYEPEYGILILPDDTKIGTDIKDIFGMNETVVESVLRVKQRRHLIKSSLFLKLSLTKTVKISPIQSALMYRTRISVRDTVQEWLRTLKSVRHRVGCRKDFVRAV